jgi:hypothetical protein
MPSYLQEKQDFADKMIRSGGKSHWKTPAGRHESVETLGRHDPALGEQPRQGRGCDPNHFIALS